MSASQRVVSKLNFALAQFGFRKRGAVLERPIVYSTSGFLGLTPRILDDGGVKVFVVAGVRHRAVYEKGVELGAYPESKTNPTLSVPLEYLRSDGQSGEYRFDGSAFGDAEETKRLVDDVGRWIIPFYEQLASPEQALQAIQRETFKTLHNVPSFVPVAQLLTGDSAGAIESAERFLASMDPKRGTGKVYRNFVDKLLGQARH